jgi:hypothetical protein
MHELKKMERYLRVNLLGTGPSSYEKKNLPGRRLTEVQKHWIKGLMGEKGLMEEYWNDRGNWRKKII